MNGQRGNVRKTDMKNQLFALLKWFYMIFFYFFLITVEAAFQHPRLVD